MTVFFLPNNKKLYTVFFQFTRKSSCNSKLKASAVLLNNSTGSVHRESNVPDPAHVLQIPAQSISPLQKISLPGSGGTSTSQAATNNRFGLAGFILSTASRPPATKFGVLAPATHHRPASDPVMMVCFSLRASLVHVHALPCQAAAPTAWARCRSEAALPAMTRHAHFIPGL
jgi:hypothetical protein